MLLETQKVIEIFKENFNDIKNKRIVLCGDERYTEAIFSIFNDFNIIGIMCYMEKKNCFSNPPFICLDDFEEYNIEVLIILDSPDKVSEIYKYVTDICSLNFIQIYGLDGKKCGLTINSEKIHFDSVLLFKKMLRHIHGKKIVLYGTGDKTRQILENVDIDNIIGIMDRNMKEGWFVNRKIISYNELLEEKVDIIISVTQGNATLAVYNRIANFCSCNHILLYDIQGNNLFDVIGHINDAVEYSPYFKKSEEDLKSEIIKHEIISFDIFDTLIMRKTFLPSDVFFIVEEKARENGLYSGKYAFYRKKAEKNIITSNPNLLEIYKELQLLIDIDDTTRQMLMELEVEIEKNILITRKKMVDIYNFALKIGKKVYLISDMYLSSSIIDEILNNLGIKGYKKLYVSCEHKASKCSGLFDIFKKECPGKTYLHIGDSEISDVYFAGLCGMDAFGIKKASDMLDISSYSQIRGYLRNVNERSLVGLFISRAFNNPFALYNTGGILEIDNIKDFAYLFLASIAVDFIIWLIKIIERNRYNRVLFAARDGYLFYDLYNMFISIKNRQMLPKALYFLTSRMVVTNSLIENENDIEWLCNQPYAFDVYEMIQRKFGIEKEKLTSYNEISIKSNLDYALENKKVIIEKSKKIKDNYSKYMISNQLNKDDNYVFVDLVSSGTCQLYLERMDAFSFDSIYLCYYNINDEKKQKLKHVERFINSNIKDTILNYEYKSHTFEDYWFLETIFTSSMPSVISFSDDGTPIYGEEPRSVDELRFVNDVQCTITEFFKDYIENLFIDGVEINKKICDILYGYKNLKYTNEHCKELNDLSLYEDMGLGKLKLNRH